MIFLVILNMWLLLLIHSGEFAHFTFKLYSTVF